MSKEYVQECSKKRSMYLDTDLLPASCLTMYAWSYYFVKHAEKQEGRRPLTDKDAPITFVGNKQDSGGNN
jgi:hypothetical protein